MEHKKNSGRSSSHGRKLQSTVGRPSRPAALHKRQPSYNNAAAHHGHGNMTTRPSLGATRKTDTEVLSYDEEETGMASFLQFCATCEKQIISPGSSILYCSESCRRKDTSQPSHLDALHSPTILPPGSSYFDSPPTNIIPQRSPTILRPLSFASDSYSETSSPTDDSFSHHDSEAKRYLSQFHSHSYSEAYQPRQTRPRVNRTSTTTESTLPSLVNTPSSSYGTAASMPSYRPLPPRHDPVGGHFPTKSADLVMPVYSSTPKSTGSWNSSASTITPLKSPPRREVAFGKQKAEGRREVGSGSLGALISRGSMEAR